MMANGGGGVAEKRKTDRNSAIMRIVGEEIPIVLLSVKINTKRVGYCAFKSTVYFKYDKI